MDRAGRDDAIGGSGNRRWCAGWLLALVAAGCAAPPADRQGGDPPALYVASGAEGTVTRLDAATGRALGPPLPAGPAPGQLVPGPGGRVLVRSIGGARQRELTLVAPAGTAPAARPIPLDARADAAQIAGDGGPFAVAAYRVPAGAAGSERARAPCRLALVDLLSGRIARTHAFGATGDVPYGVALEPGPAGLVAHVALWRRADPESGGPAGGRLESIEAETGATLAVSALAGVPGQVLLAPAPGGREPRLYCVEGLGGTEPEGADAVAGAARWRLLRLHPATLRPEGEYLFDELPRWLSITADGANAYALAGPDRRRGGPPAAATTVLHADLDTGATGPLGRVPGPGIGGLAVTAERLYAPDTTGDGVAVLRRRDGLLLDTLRVGRRPIAIATAEACPG